MEDSLIVDLYWKRDERAIRESDIKYGRMLAGISYAIVKSEEDKSECLNDTYLAAWNSMPENRPVYLGAYLSKIIRRLSINRYRMEHREKRSGIEPLTDELADCIPSDFDVEKQIDDLELSKVISDFLRSLPYEKRYIFIRRYFYSESIPDIALRTGFSISKIKTVLMRVRNSLREVLEKEDRM